MTREQWREFYRLLRVNRREFGKAEIDVLCHGIGFVRITGTDPRHIPIAAVRALLR